jgi:hypothetical protein
MMINEFWKEMIWKEAVVTHLNVLPRIRMEGVRKTEKNPVGVPDEIGTNYLSNISPKRQVLLPGPTCSASP